MPTIPKDQVNDATGMVAEGWHKARVSDCQAKVAKSSGDAYYNLSLETLAGDFIAYDVAMLEGKGNGIGIAKLLALGAAKDEGDCYEYDSAGQLRGRRAWVYVTHEEYEGKTRCKVDIRQGKCGYLPEDQQPPDVAAGGDAGGPPDDGAPPYDDSDIPF